MIVTAALIWYDERPEDLADCVRGMADIADRVVAVDGAYRRYPHARISSPPEQAEAIRKTAAEVGLICDIDVPRRLWAGQVEKRTHTLQRAAEGSDWIAVTDTDWIIHADRAAARAELEAYGPNIDVVSVPFYTPPGEHVATNWHREMSGTRATTPHLFRALPGLLVEERHWWYSAIKDGRRVWLWHGGKTPRPVLPVHELAARYEVEHRALLRDEQHVLWGRAFCNDRVLVMEQTNQEDDVPGLPRPVWDYVTVPY